jgi:hypothetical protein
MLARSATAKRLGIDGMAALRFHIRKQTRPCRFRPRGEKVIVKTGWYRERG